MNYTKLKQEMQKIEQEKKDKQDNENYSKEMQNLEIEIIRWQPYTNVCGVV